MSARHPIPPRLRAGLGALEDTMKHPRSTSIETVYTTYRGRSGGSARLSRGEIWVLEEQCDDGVVGRTRFGRLTRALRAAERSERDGLTVTISRCRLPE
jgi:hypothetical protein